MSLAARINYLSVLIVGVGWILVLWGHDYRWALLTTLLCVIQLAMSLHTFGSEQCRLMVTVDYDGAIASSCVLDVGHAGVHVDRRGRQRATGAAPGDKS